MIYGYARVSTKKQLEGNGLEVQEKAMLAAGADMVIKEQYTGTTMQRPRLDALLEHIAAGDTLMAAKLDRIARTAGEGAAVISNLQERGVAVHILNIGVLDSSTTQNLNEILLSSAHRPAGKWPGRMLAIGKGGVRFQRLGKMLLWP